MLGGGGMRRPKSGQNPISQLRPNSGPLSKSIRTRHPLRKTAKSAPPFLTFSSAERLEPLVKINIDEGQGGKIMANWTFLRRPLRAKQLRNLIRKWHTYLNNFPAARAKWLYTIWINIVSRGLRCIQVSRRLVNGILSERHDILKRLRSDRQDAVCAQSKFPQAEFKDVVAKGSAPRFGDLMKMIRFLIS